MRAFAQAWQDLSIVQAALAQLPWYHNIALIEKLDNPDERLWYARQAIQTGWSRNVLVHQIETQLYARQGRRLRISAAPSRHLNRPCECANEVGPIVTY